MEKKEDFQQALSKINLLTSQLRESVSRLASLKISVQHEFEKSQVTKDEIEMLTAALEDLVRARKDFEAEVNTFNSNFGWSHLEEVIEVNKEIDDNLNACFNIKVNVDMLVRKIADQLLINEFNDTEEESSSEDDEFVHDVDCTSHSSQPEQDNRGQETPQTPALNSGENKSLKLVIFLCLVIVIMNYVSLAIIIGYVEDQEKAEISKGNNKRQSFRNHSVNLYNSQILQPSQSSKIVKPAEQTVLC